MRQTISTAIDSQIFEAEYEVCDDTLTVFLPDGSNRKTWFRGLTPKSAALTHLIFYADTEIKKQAHN